MLIGLYGYVFSQSSEASQHLNPESSMSKEAVLVRAPTIASAVGAPRE